VHVLPAALSRGLLCTVQDTCSQQLVVRRWQGVRLPLSPVIFCRCCASGQRQHQGAGQCKVPEHFAGVWLGMYCVLCGRGTPALAYSVCLDLQECQWKASVNVHDWCALSLHVHASIHHFHIAVTWAASLSLTLADTSQQATLAATINPTNRHTKPMPYNINSTFHSNTPSTQTALLRSLCLGQENRTEQHYQ
jgi:hypothetical protein